MDKKFKKVAVCLSGHMRTYKDTAASLIKNIIDPLNCDVFIHTWDIRDHTPHGYYEDKRDDDFARVQEIFNPKCIIIEDQEEVTRNIIKPLIEKYSLRGAFHNKPEGVLCMYYKRQKVFEIIDGEYDAVITTRPDILCDKEDCTSDLFKPLSHEDMDLDVINLPKSDGMGVNGKEHIHKSSRNFLLSKRC